MPSIEQPKPDSETYTHTLHRFPQRSPAPAVQPRRKERSQREGGSKRADPLLLSSEEASAGRRHFPGRSPAPWAWARLCRRRRARPPRGRSTQPRAARGRRTQGPAAFTAGPGAWRTPPRGTAPRWRPRSALRSLAGPRREAGLGQGYGHLPPPRLPSLSCPGLALFFHVRPVTCCSFPGPSCSTPPRHWL